MSIKRFFDSSEAKGSKHYLKTQRNYELARTLILFGISAALYIAGYIQTKDRANLLTIVAVLGCLPASKGVVSVIMFARYKGCSPEAEKEISEHTDGLDGLYDCVFTSYKVNFCLSHLTVRSNTICGFTEQKDFQEQEFQKHLLDLLKLDGHKDMTVKVFHQLSKYTDRLEQMKSLENDSAKTNACIESIKNIML